MACPSYSLRALLALAVAMLLQQQQQRQDLLVWPSVCRVLMALSQMLKGSLVVSGKGLVDLVS
jgi:hypothetical protein